MNLIIFVDKMYITHGEWSSGFGGATVKKEEKTYKGLPFNCCALSLKPFSDPVCTPDGFVFDLLNIVPHIRKHGTNPVTGEPLDVKSLIKLKISKNAVGEYYCPVTLKTFTDSSHIVANRKSGHVYTQEAIERLHVQTGEWTDFITGEAFERGDLIELQNPNQREKRNIVQFQHLQPAKEEPVKSASESLVKSVEKPAAVGFTTTGKVAASLTSTGMTPVLVNEMTQLQEDEVMFRSIKTPGKAIIRTNLGDMTFELACHKAPRTCYNFIELAKKGYYQQVPFHRLIPGFMVQGGDPTGDGAGGESIWGKPFDNEFHQSLNHSKRGVLSMANRGKPCTNTSQFFILFGAKPHLDRKHPVFGHLIAGMDVLDAIEAAPTIDTRPVNLRIIDVAVMEDPFEDYKKHRDALESGDAKKRKAIATDPTLALKRAKASTNTPLTIGKYMKK